MSVMDYESYDSNGGGMLLLAQSRVALSCRCLRNCTLVLLIHLAVYFII